MNPSHSNDERVPLATVLSNQIRKHSALNYVEVARVGAVTVPAQAAKTINEALERALSTLERVPGTKVRIRADVSRKPARAIVKVLAKGCNESCTVTLD